MRYAKEIKQFRQGLIDLRGMLEQKRDELAKQTRLLGDAVTKGEAPDWTYDVMKEYERSFQSLANGSQATNSHWKIVSLLRKKGVL